MIRFLIFSVVLALLTWWLQRRLVRRTRLPQPWSRAATIALVGLWVFASIGVGSGEVFDPDWARGPAFVGWAWLGIAFYIALGLVVIALGLLVARLVRRVRRTSDGKAQGRGPLAAVRIATAVVVVAAVGVGTFGLVAAARPQVVRADIALDQLPTEFDGVRVALISDLHVGPSRGRAFTQRVVDLVNAEQPDLVLIAGDLVDGTVEKVGPDLAPLAQLSAPLGVFGVSGNHEYYSGDGGRWLDVWDGLGIHTLRNDRVGVERDGARIEIAGIHDYSAPEPYQPDLPAALAGSDPNSFVLLLAHEPRQAQEASDLGVDLQVSGHTHGGQMWPINYLVPLQQPMVEGLGTVGDTTLYTSRGAGAWGPPMRVGAAPEVTILELTRGD
ncbi:metallophosphoesterase [Tomitella biformata]|uniref:metallophosphoesterase n=1 Tax=Tomitella biformata TaxID=630403 RepID=UPI0004664465|nr:metallophosphoesterase [Tomitella biformata]